MIVNYSGGRCPCCNWHLCQPWLRIRDDMTTLRAELDAERTRFPCDGVFLSRSSPGGWGYTLIAELDDIDPVPLARVAVHVDVIARAVQQARGAAQPGYLPSAYDTALAIVRALAAKEDASSP